MTSEEIKAARNRLIDEPSVDANVEQGAALYEIAYQLAVANEREEADAARYKSWYCPTCDNITTTHAEVTAEKCWQCKTAMAVTA